MIARLFISFIFFIFVGCSTTTLVKTTSKLPESRAIGQVSLFELNNYTDTPRAGMRVANLIEGILISHNYKVKLHDNTNKNSLEKLKEIALNEGSKYFITGGVSEWRYKTGIDGEPAVSIQVTMYRTEDLKAVWSATGSQNDWGNASVGNTAQLLLESMILN